MFDRVTVNLSTFGKILSIEVKRRLKFPQVDKFTVTLSDMNCNIYIIFNLLLFFSDFLCVKLTKTYFMQNSEVLKKKKINFFFLNFNSVIYSAPT